MVADDDETGADDPNKSERKRKREKQRRSDLATAFNELESLLAQFDPDDSNDPNRRRRRKPGEEFDVDNAGMTRLDMIGRTTSVLRRLQRDNTDLRRQLADGTRNGGDDKEVLVMVPTLSPADAQHDPRDPRAPSHPPVSRTAQYPPPPFYNTAPPQDFQQPPPSQRYYGGPTHGPPPHSAPSNYAPPYPSGGAAGRGWGNPPHMPPPPVSAHYMQQQHNYGRRPVAQHAGSQSPPLSPSAHTSRRPPPTDGPGLDMDSTKY